MTPREKAESIVEKYLLIDDNSDLFCYECGMDLEASKKSAIIAVDEIIKIGYWEYMESGGQQEQNYWQQVKAEIEKM